MTNPCQACMNRDRTRRRLSEAVHRHLRVAESLARDIQTASVDELPRIEAEVEALIAFPRTPTPGRLTGRRNYGLGVLREVQGTLPVASPSRPPDPMDPHPASGPP